MHRRPWIVFILLSIATTALAQQTIYFRKDHVYANGKEIAVFMPPTTDQTAPGAPSGLSAPTSNAVCVQLNWTGSSDNPGGSGLAGYKIFRQRGTGPNLPVGTVNATTTNFADIHLQPSTSYTFTVIAFDLAQNHSAPSNAVTVVTLASGGSACGGFNPPGDTINPTTPPNFSVVYTSATSTSVSWSASTDSGGSGLAGYRVYRDGILISGSTPISAATYQDTSVAVNTAHSYYAVAVDNAGNVSPSTPARSVFRDDFNRADTTGLNNTVWASYGPWNLAGNAAVMPTGNPGWSEALSAVSFGSFRAVVNLVSYACCPNAGVTFWTDGGPNRYRFAKYSNYLYLYYYSAAGGIQLASAIDYNNNPTFRVETNAATRVIQIFVNNVLKINYSETDATRPNSGRVGLNGAVPDGTPTLTMDDFVIEER
jgi:chitodextrinase